MRAGANLLYERNMAVTQSDESRAIVEGSKGWTRPGHQTSEPNQQQSTTTGTVGSFEEYRIKVEPDEDGVFIASCPDIAGCHSYGYTLDEAFANIADAIQVSVEPGNTLNSEGVLITRLINLDASVQIAVE